MNRLPVSGSRDLRTRVFSFAGRKGLSKRTTRPSAYRGKSSVGKSPRAVISTKIGLE